MRVFSPQSVTFLTTRRCTAKCRHCLLSAEPERKEMLTYPQMETILTKLMDEADIKLVVFSGGEPTLLGEDLIKAIELCKRSGVMITRMVTNAYWARNDEVTMARLQVLKDAGLDEINLSVDDYHLEYVSLDKIRRAFDASLRLEFYSVVLANCAGPRSTITGEWLLKEFGNKDMKLCADPYGREAYYVQKQGETHVVINIGRLKRAGRGLTQVADEEFFQADSLESAGSLEKVSIGGCSDALRTISISPTGHYLACCGLDVENNPVLDYGDLNELSAETVLDRADNDLISNMIAIHGPHQIKQALLRSCPDEVSFSPQYLDICEVCYELIFVEQNRQALYKHQGSWVELVMRIRGELEAQYGQEGRVVIPPKAVILTSRAAGDDDSCQDE